MKKLHGVFILVFAAAFLAGCKDDKPAEEVVQTVDWYKAHKEERNDVLSKCSNNPGELAATANCVNASTAREDITWGSTSGIKAPKPLVFNKKKE